MSGSSTLHMAFGAMETSAKTILSCMKSGMRCWAASGSSMTGALSSALAAAI